MPSPRRANQQVPLCIDLDGTLIRSDLLFETTLILLKQSLHYLFLLPLWLLSGKAVLKQRIAEQVPVLDVQLLPYQQELLVFLQEQHAQGRHLVLATASHIKYAQQIADHLRVFDQVLATDEHENLSGSRKLARLRDLFGDKGFDYAGNAKVDLIVWSAARKAIVVDAANSVRLAAGRSTEVECIINSPPATTYDYLQALRVYQWLKNLLIFVPLIAAQWFTNWFSIGQSIVAFLAFSCCASSVYIVNDFLDLPSDRKHPRKQYRPFASGKISLQWGAITALLLLLMAFIMALLLPFEFFLTIAVYYLVTLAYTFVLKQHVIIDVVILALLYTMRIIAGITAIGSKFSFWLLGFSVFFFLSLALVKRCTELIFMQSRGLSDVPGRGYRVDDLHILTSLGCASGYISVLVLALYIQTPKVRQLYDLPEALWLLCPILIYWISRVWFKTTRGEMHDDPILFASKDTSSLLAGILIAILIAIAI